MKVYFWSIVFVILAIAGCRPVESKAPLFEPIPDTISMVNLPYSSMTSDQLYDKVLGALVGSAIGDAMGAPTEMWSRDQIRTEYGFVDSLDDMVREPSPEGTWAFNLPAGGTTDDTRWKILMADYFLDKPGEFYASQGPEPVHFAQYLVDQYTKELSGLRETKSFDPAPIESQMRRISWLQEWAQVAKPYADHDWQGYEENLHRFYGGEMVCAGMLYAPMVGALYPGAPDQAYQAAYKLALFDLGYARDITGLTAAMVAAAMAEQSTPTKILRTLRDIDPHHYFASRLVGRSSYRIYREALGIADQVKALPVEERWKQAFVSLDRLKEDFPFHAGEIHLINLTAMLVCDFDFRQSLEFVINYGRDNDTVGAVTGAILGAFAGFHKIPGDLADQVIRTNRSKLGIDLEHWAHEITNTMLLAGAVRNQ